LFSSKLESLKETVKKGKSRSGEKGKWSAGKADVRDYSDLVANFDWMA
jgi:hypothetical protein